MGLANALTLPAVMLLWSAYRSGNVIDFVLAIIDAFVIFVLGSRGALLGIAVFFLFLLANGCNRKDRRVISILFIALIVVSLVFFKPLLGVLSAIFQRLGWTSRTLRMLQQGEITYHDGREPMYNNMRAAIQSHPFALRGIGGERQYIGGAYAHNFMYELLLDFGVILGGAAILFILYLAFRTIVEAVARGDSFPVTKLIFLSVSLPVAFVSGTVWDSVYLWCWLVLCNMRYPRRIERERIESRMEDGVLLSIVVPTKNRYELLISFIELCASFPEKAFELVIQDNSDDNKKILEYLSLHPHGFVSYYYDSAKLSVSQNSELAVRNAKGRYVCFMGDDDLISHHLISFAAYMEEQGIDSAVFNTAQFNWPGVTHKVHKFPSLVVPSFDGQMRKINVNREYRRLLRTGAVSLEHMPQLYHGVVRRTVLDQVYAACGTYFPGPSPDMAVSAAMASLVKHHVFFNAPLLSSGASPKSAAGLGAKHMHSGRLQDVPHLPADIEERWDKRIPMVWTGPTIYAQSAFEALKAMRREKDLDRFNTAYFLAFFDTFCPEHHKLSEVNRKKSASWALYWLHRSQIFIYRAWRFVCNRLLLTLSMGGSLYDAVPDTVHAQRILDDEISKVPLPFA